MGETKVGKFYFLYEPQQWKWEIIKCVTPADMHGVVDDDTVAEALSLSTTGKFVKFDNYVSTEANDGYICINAGGIRYLGAGVINPTRLYLIQKRGKYGEHVGIWEIGDPVRDIEGDLIENAYYVRKIGETFEITGGK